MTDAEVINILDEVKQQALRIMADATRGRNETAADKALALADFAKTQREQLCMKNEQAAPNAYSLAALHVDPNALSHSETGFEDRG